MKKISRREFLKGGAAGMAFMAFGAGGRSSKAEEIAHIIMTFNYIDGAVLDDLDLVLEQINEITRDEIGVEVEFRTVNSVDAFTEYPLWLSQKETIDLMLLNYQDITTYVNNEMLQPIGELLKSDGQGILELIEEQENLTVGTTINGSIYGLRSLGDTIGSGGGIWISQKYLDEVGFTYMENTIYTKEELEELFAQLKELYPESYPLGQITSENEFSTYSYYYGTPLTIGSVSNTGYLGEDGQITDFYESDPYYEFLSQMKRWYDAGYIYPDAAITDASQLSLLQAGIILSVPIVSTPGMVSGPYGDDMVCLMTSRVTYGPDNSSRGIFWTIPETSEEPEAAMRFLNLMYTDERIVNLLQWGIEGTHYEFVDEDEGIIVYPEGKNEQTVGYYNPLGLYGNQQLSYTMEGSPTRSEKQAYSELAEPLGWEYADFIFDSSEVSVELVNIQNVLSRYYPALESGGVDLETMYPQFVQELKDAGMDEVIEEVQAQFDAWQENG